MTPEPTADPRTRRCRPRRSPSAVTVDRLVWHAGTLPLAMSQRDDFARVIDVLRDVDSGDRPTIAVAAAGGGRSTAPLPVPLPWAVRPVAGLRRSAYGVTADRLTAAMRVLDLDAAERGVFRRVVELLHRADSGHWPPR